MPMAIVVQRGGILGLFLLLAGCPHSQVKPLATRQAPLHQPSSPGVGTSQVRPEQAFPPAEQPAPINPAAPSPGPLPTVTQPGQEDSKPSTDEPKESADSQEREQAAIAKLQQLGAQITREVGSEDLVVDLALVKADDEVADWLAQLPRIKKVDLSGTQITDAALARLSALERLEFLNLANTAVGDAGIESLAAMKNLKYLVLNWTQITDKSLPHLAKLSSLEGVSLLNTSLTASAVETLKQQKPKCTVLFQKAEDSPPQEPETQSNSTGSSAAEPCEFVAPSRTSPGTLPASPVLTSLAQQTAEELQDPHFLHAVSEVYLERGEWSKAVNVLKKAVKRDETDSRLRYHLGIALGRSGQLEASFEELAAATGKAAAHYNIGIIIYENALEESQRHFQQALALDPDLADAQAWIQHLQSQMSGQADVEILPASGFAHRESEHK